MTSYLVRSVFILSMLLAVGPLGTASAGGGAAGSHAPTAPPGLGGWSGPGGGWPGQDNGWPTPSQPSAPAGPTLSPAAEQEVSREFEAKTATLKEVFGQRLERLRADMKVEVEALDKAHNALSAEANGLRGRNNDQERTARDLNSRHSKELTKLEKNFTKQVGALEKDFHDKLKQKYSELKAPSQSELERIAQDLGSSYAKELTKIGDNFTGQVAALEKRLQAEVARFHAEDIYPGPGSRTPILPETKQIAQPLPLILEPGVPVVIDVVIDPSDPSGNTTKWRPASRSNVIQPPILGNDVGQSVDLPRDAGPATGGTVSSSGLTKTGPGQLALSPGIAVPEGGSLTPGSYTGSTTVSTMVRDTDGKARPYANVQIKNETGQPLQIVKADATGRVDWTPTRAGKYLLVLTTTGDVTGTAAFGQPVTFTATIPAGKTKSSGGIQMDMSPRPVLPSGGGEPTSGIAYDIHRPGPPREPLANIDVVVKKNPGGIAVHFTSTDGDGNFTAGVGPGEYVFELSGKSLGTAIDNLVGKPKPGDTGDRSITLSFNVQPAVKVRDAAMLLTGTGTVRQSGANVPALGASNGWKIALGNNDPVVRFTLKISERGDVATINWGDGKEPVALRGVSGGGVADFNGFNQEKAGGGGDDTFSVNGTVSLVSSASISVDPGPPAAMDDANTAMGEVSTTR